MGRGRGRRTSLGHEQMVKQTQSDMARATHAVKGSTTFYDMMKRLYEEFYNRPDDPTFEEWINARKGE